MNQRLRARAQKETPATANRSRSLEGLGTTYRLRLSLALVNVLVTCRALIFLCSHLGPRPQIEPQPLFQPGDGSEVGEHLARQHTVHRQSIDACFPLNRSQGKAHGRQRTTEALDEHLGIASTRRGVRYQAAGRPSAVGDVLARRGVTTRPGHGLRLLTTRCVVARCCYRGGYYKIHHRELPCRATSSSGVTS